MKPTTFQIGKDKYEVRDLTIQDYYDMQLELTLSDQLTGFKVVSELSGCPVDRLRSLSYDNWLALWITVQNQINTNITIEDSTFSPTVEVNGVTYGLINMDKITVGEFADLDVILSSANVERRLHEAMAVLYRPVTSSSGKKYKIEDYDSDTFADRAESFRNFSLPKAKVALTYFLLSGNRSLGATLDYLSKTIQEMATTPEMQEKVQPILTKLQEDGLALLSRSQEKTLSRSKKRHISRFGRLLIGLRGKLIKLGKRLQSRKKNYKNIEDN